MSDSFETPWTVAHQASLSMGYPREKYWNRLPFPSPGHLPDSGIKTGSPVLTGEFFITEPPRKPHRIIWGRCFTLVLNYIYLVLKMNKNQTLNHPDRCLIFMKQKVRILDICEQMNHGFTEINLISYLIIIYGLA